MKTFEVWYFIGSTEFYEVVDAASEEDARKQVVELLSELGYPNSDSFIDSVVEVGNVQVHCPC